MNIISKSANLAPYLKATNTIVSASLKPLASAVILPSENHVDKPANVLASYKSGPIGSISAISGVGGSYKIIKSLQFNAKNYELCNCSVRMDESFCSSI